MAVVDRESRERTSERRRMRRRGGGRCRAECATAPSQSESEKRKRGGRQEHMFSVCLVRACVLYIWACDVATVPRFLFSPLPRCCLTAVDNVMAHEPLRASCGRCCIFFHLAVRGRACLSLSPSPSLGYHARHRSCCERRNHSCVFVRVSSEMFSSRVSPFVLPRLRNAKSRTHTHTKKTLGEGRKCVRESGRERGRDA